MGRGWGGGGEGVGRGWGGEWEGRGGGGVGGWGGRACLSNHKGSFLSTCCHRCSIMFTCSGLATNLIGVEVRVRVRVR